MYSNNNKGFSIVDILVKIVFALFFILILMWLFNKNVPNMEPFYSNVFRENIKYMQEAGESYFTNEKLPKKVGEEVKLTLSEMFNKKYVLPFVDEEGNSCNQYESYVSVTKETEDNYLLKTNLVCNNQQDYTVKVLGCYTYCKTASCENSCTVEKITKYQFSKKVETTKNKYSCDAGFKLDGKTCYKSVLKDSVSAEIKVIKNQKYIEDAIAINIKGNKTELNKIEKISKETIDAIKVTTDKTKTELNTIKKSVKEYVDNIPEQTKVNTVSYSCTKRVCTTKYVSSSYSCNCTSSVGPTGKTITTCGTCYTSIPVESCSNQNSTCTKQETVVIPASCPKNTITEGSGKDIKCYTVKKEYSCPSESNYSEGSGKDLKCYKVEEEKITYKCKDNSYTLNGDKCIKETKEYVCPSESNYSEGTGKDLKCYKVDADKVEYECKDKTYTLDGNKCYKYVKVESTELKCDKGYKLEGNKCNKYEKTTKKANVKKVKSSYTKYQWSTKEEIPGWTKTGKIKIEEGKKVCKNNE